MGIYDLEVFLLAAHDGCEQVVSQTAGAEAEETVVEPIFAEDLLHQGIVSDSLIGRADTSGRFVALDLACLFFPRLDSLVFLRLS